MKLLYGYTKGFDFPHKGCVMTIGNFDGVHRGHQALLAELKKRGQQFQLPVVVLLFEPQPNEYFASDKAPQRLTSLREKLMILAQCAVDYVCCLKFNPQLANCSAEDFAEKVIFAQFSARYLLLGSDFRFGLHRQGDVALLQNLGKYHQCLVDSFPNFEIDGLRVSSTKIRELLRQAALSEVHQLLGRAYSLCGRVTMGNRRGRQWGIPTANILIKRPISHFSGVYCVRVQRADGSKIFGVANLGIRPTFNGSKTYLEIHLLEFNDNIYGERLQVFFLHKLREEVKFNNVDNLIKQIKLDIQAAQDYFKHYFVSDLTF